MRGVKNVTLPEVCAGVEDPRADRVNKFSLVELLFAAMITVLCGAVSYADMAQTGEKKLEWFRKYLAYDNGMPKAGTFRDVLCRLNLDEVHKAFIAWMEGAVETLQAAGVIAVDGKRQQDRYAEASAFSGAANLAIGQIACEEKSNEITAVPRLLEMLDIHGCLVATDAMGAQREITEQIVRQGGDYLLLRIFGFSDILPTVLLSVPMETRFPGLPVLSQIKPGLSQAPTEIGVIVPNSNR